MPQFSNLHVIITSYGYNSSRFATQLDGEEFANIKTLGHAPFMVVSALADPRLMMVQDFC